MLQVEERMAGNVLRGNLHDAFVYDVILLIFFSFQNIESIPRKCKSNVLKLMRFRSISFTEKNRGHGNSREVIFYNWNLEQLFDLLVHIF